ncbi:hypothetical protein E2C01_072718 [Portunus trituberculatus]|uniref:Uncharacterized protein n=1 Tax=Portunus trituberculatus TaxID=210409 RepID=A0A5B7IC57_PORTR|nr:hypothetical protein [Portunus trituberculatus]
MNDVGGVVRVVRVVRGDDEMRGEGKMKREVRSVTYTPNEAQEQMSEETKEREKITPQKTEIYEK